MSWRDDKRCLKEALMYVCADVTAEGEASRESVMYFWVVPKHVAPMEAEKRGKA